MPSIVSDTGSQTGTRGAFFTPTQHTFVDSDVEPPTNRLSLDPYSRTRTAVAFAALTGAALGVSHGAQTTGLRFRAENSHRLPTTERGWYLYHKSKNYAVMLGGFREALRMGAKLGIWTGLYFVIEEAMDRYKRTTDAASSVCAGLTVAGAFSLWNQLPVSTAARVTRIGLFAGLGYGLTQDAFALLQGRKVNYVEWFLKDPSSREKRSQEAA